MEKNDREHFSSITQDEALDEKAEVEANPPQNIEDTIFDTHLPGNTFQMFRRGLDLMREAKRYSYPSLGEEEKHQYKKLLWLICDQVYGGIACVDFMKEWRNLKEKEVEINAGRFAKFSAPSPAITARDLEDDDIEVFGATS